MRIYKKAFPLLLRIGILIILINLIVVNLPVTSVVIFIIVMTIIIAYLFVIGFFRIPDRKCIPDNNLVCAPADGRIISIELGFILFGSRVDIYIPKEATILAKLGNKVKANKHVIARFGS